MKSFIVLFLAICLVGVYSHPHHEGHDHHHEGHDHHHEHDHNHEHAGLTAEQKAKLHADVDECAKEYKLAPEILDDIHHARKFTPTRELDCFSLCFFKKDGTMNADGSLIERADDPAEAKECKKLTGTDDCNTAGKIMGCLYEHHLIPSF